jgi:hypothetical protein
MKKQLLTLATFIFVLNIIKINAQAFHRNTFLVSVSEGHTSGFFRTKEITDGNKTNKIGSEYLIGLRDPLIIEFGITNRLSIGLSSGTDIFEVNGNNLYNLQTNNSERLKVKTNEFTFDSNYHFFVNKRLDLSVFGSFGVFSTSFNYKPQSDAAALNYSANGGILRGGIKARYYFWRGFGAFGMLSAYNAFSNPEEKSEVNFGNTIRTNVWGRAIEAGLCVRIF